MYNEERDVLFEEIFKVREALSQNGSFQKPLIQIVDLMSTSYVDLSETGVYVTNPSYVYADAVDANNTLKVYVNGVQLPTTVVGNGANISSNSDVRVGWSYNTSRLFQGSIPITKVYNKTLTPEEVSQDYDSYKNRFDI